MPPLSRPFRAPPFWHTPHADPRPRSARNGVLRAFANRRAHPSRRSSPSECREWCSGSFCKLRAQPSRRSVTPKCQEWCSSTSCCGELVVSLRARASHRPCIGLRAPRLSPEDAHGRPSPRGNELSCAPCAATPCNLTAAGRRPCDAQGLASIYVVLQIAASRARAASPLQRLPRCLCATASSSF